MLKKLVTIYNTEILVNPNHIVAIEPGGETNGQTFSKISFTAKVSGKDWVAVFGDDKEVTYRLSL